MANTTIPVELSSTPGIVDNSNATAITIDSSENVGIGTSPATKLDVLDANGIGLRFGDIASTPSSQTAGYIGMSTSAYSGNNGDLVLIPRTSATSNILLMEGNVGIGTTSPSGEFHVDSGLAPCDIHFTTGSSGGTGYDVNLNLTGGANNAEMNLNMGIAGNADREQIKTYQSTMRFITADTERLRIDSSGKVSIGGSAISNAALTLENSANTKMVMRMSTASAGSFWRQEVDASNVFYIINQSSTGVYISSGSTSWTGISDENLKENIVELTGVLDKVKDFRCVEYNLISDENKSKKIGFIAQDWQEDYSQVVSQDNNGNLGMQYTETIPVLLKAIQEQQTLIESLTARITTLEG